MGNLRIKQFGKCSPPENHKCSLPTLLFQASNVRGNQSRMNQVRNCDSRAELYSRFRFLKERRYGENYGPSRSEREDRRRLETYRSHISLQVSRTRDSV